MTHLRTTISHHSWRAHRQQIGTVLAALIAATMIASLYLSVTARAALLGREIQKMEDEIQDVRYQNVDLETELASILSEESMRSRVLEAGFREVSLEEIEYIYIPGYAPPERISPSQAPHAAEYTFHETPPEYTESLFEWIRKAFEGTAARTARLP